MRGVFLHVLGDALGSVVVMISAGLTLIARNYIYACHIDVQVKGYQEGVPRIRTLPGDTRTLLPHATLAGTVRGAQSGAVHLRREMAIMPVDVYPVSSPTPSARCVAPKHLALLSSQASETAPQAELQVPLY